MNDVSRSHKFEFSMYGVPTLNAMIAELTNAQEVMGGNAKVRFKITDDQRDGYSVATTVTE